MGVSVVFGGQFGSEGKGKIARYFALRFNASTVVRVGGSNSGHTVIDSNGNPKVFKILPAPAIDRQVTCVLPAGSYIDSDLLFQEIYMAGIDNSQVKIHPNAVLINSTHSQVEESLDLRTRIGSTLSGTGAGVSMRVNRDPAIRRAIDDERLLPFICDTTRFLRNELKHNKEVVIEGTQGFGLSNLYSPYYPFATSRDTSAAGFLSEAGLSPFDVTNVIMVLRAFPIRVGGNSGPLPDEITWEDVSNIAGREGLFELTSVTKTLRRVAKFNPDVVRQAITVNKPSFIALNHCDYFDYTTHDTLVLSPKIRQAVAEIEEQIEDNINFVGTGADTLISI